MDKAILKNFAIESRKDLMEKVERKIKLFYIDEELKKENRGDVIVLSNDKHSLTLTKEEDANRDKLIKRIVELGLKQVIEEAAYTWFNRIIAIRYMEIHDFIPLTIDNQSLGIRVLSSKDNVSSPEILKFSNLVNPNLSIDFNKETYAELKDDNEKFKYILLLICKKLGKVIPRVFGGITDYIDILIPDNMLSEHGFIRKMITDIDEINFKEVEIIGWLYQYYVADKKKEVDEKLNKGNKITKEELPAKTQLFTPNEIVKYMVDNCSYINDIEKMKIIDPCCGSGHILVSVFDRLFEEYTNRGYSKNSIAQLILENNIYGSDIDQRAVQLSTLSLLLKAREYDNKIFNKDLKINLATFEDSNNIKKEYVEFILDNLDTQEKKDILTRLLDNFKNATEIGSILLIQNYDYISLYNEIEYNISKNGFDLISMSIWNDVNETLKNILYLGSYLSNKYDIVITNPPYLGRKNCSASLNNFLDNNYPNSKMDLFSAFIEKTINMCKENGNVALMTPFTWLYLSSYKLLRKYVLDNARFESILNPYDGFFNDAAVTICSFVLKITNKEVIAKNLFLDSSNKIQLINTINNEKFLNIPENRFVFDITDKLIELYNQRKIEEVFKPRQGMATTNNDLFLRRWYEVNIDKIGFNMKNAEEALESKKKWFPYNKGGGKRKWYGNNEFVVNFENNGQTIANYIDNFSNSRVKSNGRIINREYYFKKSITWSDICGDSFSARACGNGFIFDVKGSSGFVNDEEYLYILSLLNSNVSVRLLNMLNPTITTQVGNLKDIPYIFDKNMVDKIKSLASENISISKEDWNNRETSWDFENNLLIVNCNNGKIQDACKTTQLKQKENHEKLLSNEKKLNEIFINIYGLENEVSSKVLDSDISILVQDDKELIKDFISYSVGCMFGRYSVDKKGLILASSIYDKNNYNSYMIDEDNIIPISDDDSIYYNDDIVSKFIEFVKTVFGKENLSLNIDFIAETLGKKGTETSEETIRRYFVNGFYNDHKKMYQKRPIYWLFDSGNKNGFKCLIYIHRYDEQIVSKIRTKYLHNTIAVYQRLVEEINYKLNNNDLNTFDKRELQNKKSDLNGKITECNEYEEMIGNVANKMIKLDLDDGVVVNYSKFIDDNGKSILANIK